MTEQLPVIADFYKLWHGYMEEKQSLLKEISVSMEKHLCITGERRPPSHYALLMVELQKKFVTKVSQWYMDLDMEDQITVVKHSLMDSVMYVYTFEYWTAEQDSYFTLIS